MELMPVKFDQVLIHCSDSDSVLVHWHSALLAWQAQMTSHHTKQKNYGLHRIAHVHNIVHVNCCTCTYIFPKQNGGSCKNFYGMHFVFIFSLTLCPIVVEQSCMEWFQVKKKSCILSFQSLLMEKMICYWKIKKLIVSSTTTT